ncbi:MAG: hypothetical protein FWG25_10925 [Promicromonosporaceae bacterium]|nr:hypothetical protein [Promicromonosporaceae bacterium]
MSISNWRFRPGTMVVECAPGVVQIGGERRWAFRMSDITPAELEWLRMGSCRSGEFRSLARKCGVSKERAQGLCETLARSGFLIPTGAIPGTLNQPKSGPIGTDRAGGASDVSALGALRPDGQGSRTLFLRGLSRVAITTSNRLGAQIALQLAAAGIGHLQLPDTARVDTNDLGPYQLTDLGNGRQEALSGQIAALGLDPRYTLDDTPHLIISLENGVASGNHLDRFQQAAIPHLPIVVSETTCEVGPLVLPGRSACTNCVNLYRAGADSSWGAVSDELRSRKPFPIETLLATTTAALVTAQVLGFVDGTAPSLLNHIASVELPGVGVKLAEVVPNPACGCIAGPEPR